MFSLGNTKKIIFELSSNTNLSGALISGVTGLLHDRIMTPKIQEHLIYLYK